MTSRTVAQLFAFSALGLLFAASASCDDNCRSFTGTVDANCAPICESVEDCEAGEICVVDNGDESIQICALPCTSSSGSCACECADGESGYCGAPEWFSLECRADGDMQYWQETRCKCASLDDPDAFDDCMEGQFAREASTPEVCVPLLANELFCLHHNTTITTAEVCEIPDGACAAEQQALSDCEQGA